MFLKEYLPPLIQLQHAVPSIETGVVVKVHLSTVSPPKEKRLIVVGESPDRSQVALVYINSKLNKKVHRKRKAQKLHKFFEAKDRDFLDWSSYVDCTQLIMIEKDKIKQAVVKSPSRVIGWISDFDFNSLKNLILISTTIKAKYKNKFGFYA